VIVKTNDIKMVRTIVLLFLSVHSMGQSADLLVKNRWIEKQLKIRNIEQASYNDVDLRVFLDPGITNGGHVIQIIKNKDRWVGVKYDYILRIRNGSVTKKIRRTTRTKVKPSDWNRLWSRLRELDILTLPDQEAIRNKLRKEVTTIRGKGYSAIAVNDGSGYDLLVKNENTISKYSFHEPWTYAEHYPDVDEVRKYSEIIATLERELSIYFRK
jgi:hypothetical protein